MSNYLKTGAVIFDMDGVLVDSEPLWLESEYEILKTVGIDSNNSTCPIDTLGLRINETVAAWYHFYPWKGKTQQQLIDEIEHNLIKKVTSTNLILPGVVDTLELCHQSGLKIGLASSSSSRVINAIVEYLNLSHYFQICYSAESLAHGKPHPEVYLLAAEALGVSPLNCVTIEDSINGMIATKAARMRSIVVPAKELRDDPGWVLADIKLNSLTEISAQDILG